MDRSFSMTLKAFTLLFNLVIKSYISLQKHFPVLKMQTNKSQLCTNGHVWCKLLAYIEIHENRTQK